MAGSPVKSEEAEDKKAVSPSPVPEDVEAKPSNKVDDAPGAEAEGKSDSGSEGEVEESDEPENPPLPSEPLPSAGPPLPNEPVPAQEDDGWDCQWDATSQSWFFYNRLTGMSQWDNPRIPSAGASAPTVATAPGTEPSAPLPPAHEQPIAGGYNPAIHGDYDPTAWYAQGNSTTATDPSLNPDTSLPDPYATAAAFNRFTGQFQAADMGPDRHTDEAKSKRQMNAFFDVDAAANAHDGRSLKAERSGKKVSKGEVKAFKEKRRARKEEKRRAWLRD